jgi:Ca2+-binding EF-hand superfamily protein
MPSTVAAALVLAGVFAGGAWAADVAPPAHDPRAAFAETDTDKNGVVDRGEFNARIVEVFYFADTDRDGTLTPEEQKRLVFPEDFKAVDKDGDGRLTLREFLRVRFADFDVADTNEDGVLSVEEVVAAFEGKAR